MTGHNLVWVQLFDRCVIRSSYRKFVTNELLLMKNKFLRYAKHVEENALWLLTVTILLVLLCIQLVKRANG